MNELQIRILLKEFDYDKNTLEDIFDFLLFMADGIEKIIRKDSNARTNN